MAKRQIGNRQHFTQSPYIIGSVYGDVRHEPAEYNPQRSLLKESRWSVCPHCKRYGEGKIIFGKGSRRFKDHLSVHRMGIAYRKAMVLVNVIMGSGNASQND